MIFALTAIAITLVAIGGGTLLVRRSTAGKTRQVMILLFGLYFWLLVFAQLIVAAIVYALLNR